MGRSFGGVVEGAKLACREKRKEGQPDRRLGYLFIIHCKGFLSRKHKAALTNNYDKTRYS